MTNGIRVGNKSGAHTSSAPAHRDHIGRFASGGRVSSDNGGDGAALGGLMGHKAKHRPDKGGKKGTHINIMVGSPHGVAPPAGGIGGPAPVGPMMGPPGLPPMAPPPPGPPIPMRASGGRVNKGDGPAVKNDFDAGSISGEGRLEKIDAYGKNAGPKVKEIK